MPQYRKKPVVIEAVQYIDQFTPHLPDDFHDALQGPPSEPYIRTLEGDMRVNRGDYIIRGIKGEFYPCKPDIFEATSERVDGDA